MNVIKIEVKKKIAKSPSSADVFIICGNSDYFIDFDFDEEWGAHAVKTARFITLDGYQDVVFNGNRVNVPVLRRALFVTVGVYAGNLCTTTPAIVPCKRSILCKEGPPADPDPDVYAQLIAMINAGMVKGDKGEPFEYEDFTPEQLEDLRSELAVDYREDEESIYISGYDPKINMDVLVQKGEFNEKLSKKQDTVAFDGVYNAETNKAATVETVIRKVAEIVAGAPEDFNTLKELSDWLTSHEGSAAAMNTAIAKNAENIEKTKTETDEKLAKKVDKIPFSKDTTVHGSDAGYVGRAYIVDHDGNQNSMAINAQAFNYTIPCRNYNANFYVGDPNLPYECTNRKYVDNLPDYLKLTDDSTAEDGTVTKGTRTKWREWLGAVGEKDIVYDAENESLTIGGNE